MRAFYYRYIKGNDIIPANREHAVIEERKIHRFRALLIPHHWQSDGNHSHLKGLPQRCAVYYTYRVFRETDDTGERAVERVHLCVTIRFGLLYRG